MARNVFKFCTALRAPGSIMIVFVIGIIGFTFYSVVVAPALFHGDIETLVSLLVLLFFHFLVFGTDKKFWFFPAYSREDRPETDSSSTRF